MTSPTAYSQSLPSTRQLSSTSSHEPGLRPTVSRPRSSVRGARPVANRISSASTVSPLSSSTVTGPSCPARLTEAADTPVRTRAPASVSASPTSCPANGSILGSSRSPRTSIVTWAPSPCHAVAISTPTTPPPTTTSRPGTSLALVASRLVHGRTVSTPGKEGTTALLPVHTATACRAVRRVSWPSGPVTVTSLGPVSRPLPRWTAAPIPSSQETCPSSFQWEVSSSRNARTASASSGPRTAPLRPGTLRASARDTTGLNRALLGMQAQYEHSPPTSSDSTTAVLSPAALVRSATFSPTGPAPITTTSYAVFSVASVMGPV